MASTPKSATVARIMPLQIHVDVFFGLRAGMGDRPQTRAAHKLRIFPQRARGIDRLVRAFPVGLARGQFFVGQRDRQFACDRVDA